MAHIDALVDKVADAALREALRAEVATMLSRRSFGLVFQDHRPETVELPQHRVRRGDKVRVRDEEERVLYRVDRITGPNASLTSLTNPPLTRTVPRSAAVVVREFGDPVYPGLSRTGSVHRGGDKPSHVVINAENFHALETLLYTHEGKLDAIYIDPPYNTRDKDWKYNNDYVDSTDVYSHSKWLAMMQRRLRLAKRLLNPLDSVLIVTIDEREYSRLGLLLEQIFPDARIQMVSVSINPAASARNNMFGRADEYAYFVMLGTAGPRPTSLGPDWITTKGRTHLGNIRWDLLRKSGSSPLRQGHPGTFYPVFVRSGGEGIHSIGDILEVDQPRDEVKAPAGTVAVFPLREDGTEGRWAVGPVVAREILVQGYLKLGRFRGEDTAIYYLAQGERRKIERGIYTITGHAPDGSVLTDTLDTADRHFVPGTQWRIPSHDATQYGSRLLQKFLPGRHFPFPKSLYLVEDTLRFFLVHKPEAMVLDFFAGSGTTMHAVARLNRQDAGRRTTISITNNEVSDEEAQQLRAQGHHPGDPEWEGLGIAEFITKPRVKAAIEGRTPDDKAIAGDYRAPNEAAMAEGFDENAEFFNLTYEDADLVSLGRNFEAIAPLLWLKAGGRGGIIKTIATDWSLPPHAHYGVLFDTNRWRWFVEASAKRDDLTHIYVVTDSDATFQQIVSELPRHLDSTQLYEDYLHNFQINTRGRM